jgi:hypothetical protein
MGVNPLMNYAKRHDSCASLQPDTRRAIPIISPSPKMRRIIRWKNRDFDNLLLWIVNGLGAMENFPAIDKLR